MTDVIKEGESYFYQGELVTGMRELDGLEGRVYVRKGNEVLEVPKADLDPVLMELNFGGFLVSFKHFEDQKAAETALEDVADEALAFHEGQALNRIYVALENLRTQVALEKRFLGSKKSMQLSNFMTQTLEYWITEVSGKLPGCKNCGGDK